jgi:hypothetical protein
MTQPSKELENRNPSNYVLFGDKASPGRLLAFYSSQNSRLIGFYYSSEGSESVVSRHRRSERLVCRTSEEDDGYRL